MPAELVIRQRFSALAKALPMAVQGNPVAVHQARVATRRLREALAMTRGRASRKVQTRVRRITRTLGPIRELDVMLDLLASMVAEDRIAPAAATCVRESVRDERQHLTATLGRRLGHCNLDKLRRKAVAASSHQVDARDANITRLANARHRAARRAQAVRDAMDHAGAIYLSHRLHELRIALKKLRYSMEIVRELSRSRARVALARLKAVQDLLGRMHDLEMLIVRTRAVQASPRGPDLDISAELDRFVRHLETECRRLHGHYIAMRRELLRICDRVIAAAEKEARGRPRRAA
jgi:CHAD domain-containing protein